MGAEATRAPAPPLAGLVLVGEAPEWATTVGGLSVLTRAIAALGRVAPVVAVAQWTQVPASLRRRVQDELARLPHPPAVRFDAVPDPGSALVVVVAPGIFDPRIVSRAAVDGDEGGAPPPEAVLAFSRRGEGHAFLWAVGARRSADALAGLRSQAALAALRTGTIDPGPALCEALGEVPLEIIREKLLAGARKASDSWVARNLDRRISLALTRRLLRYPITPNQVTVASTAIGLLGAAGLAVGTDAAQLLGALLLTLAIIVDGCDGEVARLKFMESEVGRKLDFFLDNVVNVAAIFAVGAGYAWQSGQLLYLYASAFGAVAAVAAVAPVYVLYFRAPKAAVGAGEAQEGGMSDLVEAIAGRDFAYLILALALFGRAEWFSLICAVGIVVFLVVVAVVYAREHSARPAA